jgi:GDP-L-fucose synthase
MDLSNNQFSSLLSPDYSLPAINIDWGKEQTISSLADLVAGVGEFQGEIHWDATKPDGTLRKLVDISRLTALGWSPRVDLGTGIRTTYEWYLNQLNF